MDKDGSRPGQAKSVGSLLCERCPRGQAPTRERDRCIKCPEGRKECRCGEDEVRGKSANGSVAAPIATTAFFASTAEMIEREKGKGISVLADTKSNQHFAAVTFYDQA